MILRDGVMEDAADLARIHRAARAAAMPWLPVLHSPEEDLRYFRRHVLPDQRVRVIEENGRVTAFAAFHDGWLNHLYVAPEVWRQGLGRRLLMQVQSEAQRLQLWTFQGNRAARAFYARHGFVEVESTEGAGNEEKTPDVRMIWPEGAVRAHP